MKADLLEETGHELVKGQSWQTTRGLVQIVDLGKSLVYYRVSRNHKSATLIRILRRDIFQQQLQATAGILLG